MEETKQGKALIAMCHLKTVPKGPASHWEEQQVAGLDGSLVRSIRTLLVFSTLLSPTHTVRETAEQHLPSTEMKRAGGQDFAFTLVQN